VPLAAQVVVGPFLASRNEPAGVHVEVGTHVDQELPFVRSVCNEEAACCRADVPPVMSAASVSLLVVGVGRSTLLRCDSEAAMVPAEGGCGVASGKGSAVRSAIPGAGARIYDAGARVPGGEGSVPEAGAEAVLLGAECHHLSGEVLDLLQKCGIVGGLDRR
jgi:hypothetical protein